eukprot:13881665-Alexandrium_andersonii.AAC.1
MVSASRHSPAKARAGISSIRGRAEVRQRAVHDDALEGEPACADNAGRCRSDVEPAHAPRRPD